MIINNKFFAEPPQKVTDLRELLNLIVSSGSGMPVDASGISTGPWTPERLRDAISQFELNTHEINLRTVQHWFEGSEKGVSATNIRWLSRVAGCDDPSSVAKWQLALGSAQSRLLSKRRVLRSEKAGNGARINHLGADSPSHSTDKEHSRFDLPKASEAIFSGESPINLAVCIFAGSVALCFLSYVMDVHSVIAVSANGFSKEVGFLWAPNWTYLFMIFLPIFAGCTVNVLSFWKKEARINLLAIQGPNSISRSWDYIVGTSKYTFWAVFLIFVFFAGIFQWVSIRLVPLLNGSNNFAMDWGSVSLERPEVISVPESIVFTALAYAYMAVCFYIFFVGLILLYSMIRDLSEIAAEARAFSSVDFEVLSGSVGMRIMNATFRCTILGLLIAITMKVQAFYLVSSAENIIVWFKNDVFSVLRLESSPGAVLNISMPNNFTSLIVALATLFVFIYATVILGFGRHFQVRIMPMLMIIIVLTSSYMTIGLFSGFSVLMIFALLLSICGIMNPSMAFRRKNYRGAT